MNWNQGVPTFWGDGQRYSSNQSTQVEGYGCLYPALGDLDNDGMLDLICPNVAENDTSGNCQKFQKQSELQIELSGVSFIGRI